MSGDSHKWNLLIFVPQDENKLSIYRKNLNFLFIIFIYKYIIKASIDIFFPGCQFIIHIEDCNICTCNIKISFHNVKKKFESFRVFK